MANRNQFDESDAQDLSAEERDAQRLSLEASGAQGLPVCAVCEALLPEALDNTLSDAQRHAFDTHIATCSVCSREFAEAQRGAAWLSLLKQQAPEPPAGLLASILAQTSGAMEGQAVLPRNTAVARPEPAYVSLETPLATPLATPRRQPIWQQGWSRTKQRWMAEFARLDLQSWMQPRLAMTAAMAFFSIALTLSISGVRLENLHASDFTPAGLRRSVADAGASMTRSVVNNRSVYQVESRLSELRTNGDEQ